MGGDGARDRGRLAQGGRERAGVLGVAREDVAAAGDSCNDLPMLAFAAERGEAFAVNPDGMLRSEAARRGWRIMDIFKKDRA